MACPGESLSGWTLNLACPNEILTDYLDFVGDILSVTSHERYLSTRFVLLGKVLQTSNILIFSDYVLYQSRFISRRNTAVFVFLINDKFPSEPPFLATQSETLVTSSNIVHESVSE